MNENQESPSKEKALVALLDQVKGMNSYVFFEALDAEIRKALKAGDRDMAEFYRLPGGVFSMMLRPDPETPYAPMSGTPDGKRSMLPSDLTDQQLVGLERMMAFSSNAAYVARISDVLFIRLRHQTYAKKAVDAYVKAAQDVDLDWFHAVEYLRRAAQLTLQLGNNSPEKAVVTKAIMGLFDEKRKSCFTPDGGAFPLMLAEILIENRMIGDFGPLGDQCMEIAKGFPTAPGCDDPRDYYAAAARCYRIAHQDDKAKEAQLAIAKHWEAEANTFRNADGGGDGLQIAHRITSAIEAYRSVGGQLEKMEELTVALKAANLLLQSQMKTIEIPMDFTPLVVAGREAMNGKSGMEAILAFVHLYEPSDYDKMRKRVEKQSADHPFHTLVETQVLVPEGNVSARTPGAFDDPEGQIKGQVCRAYLQQQGLAGGPVFEEALRVLRSSSDESWKAALQEVIKGNPFVNADRREIYEKALAAGVAGDGVVFAHLIIPQVEAWVRELFAKRGLKTTTADPKGTQQELDLNSMLWDSGAEGVFGKGLLWEMRVCLIEQAGSNLRNRVCHGLMAVSYFSKPEINFLLWLSLYLLVEKRHQ